MSQTSERAVGVTGPCIAQHLARAPCARALCRTNSRAARRSPTAREPLGRGSPRRRSRSPRRDDRRDDRRDGRRDERRDDRRDERRDDRRNDRRDERHAPSDRFGGFDVRRYEPPKDGSSLYQTSNSTVVKITGLPYDATESMSTSRSRSAFSLLTIRVQFFSFSRASS